MKDLTVDELLTQMFRLECISQKQTLYYRIETG